MSQVRRRAPLVSVVLATYNWSSVLRYSIASALEQELDEIELLVIGDGCTDDSAEVAASFHDVRVRWHNLERNTGSQAIPNNTGIALARGRYVAYLGHDDLWHPSHLRRLVPAIEEVGADLAFSVAEVILPSGERQLSGLFASGAPSPHDFIVPSSLLHRRTLIEEVGPWPDYRTVDLPPDAEWQQRVWRAGKRWLGIEALTVFKFPSAARRNSYLERACAEQAEYARRMREEPDFVPRELLAVCRSNLIRPPRAMLVPSVLAGAPKGWSVRGFRQIRGLEPELPEMLPLPPEVGSRLAVTVLAAPPRVEHATTFEIEVEVENGSRHLLASTQPHPVHLSYRWLNAAGEVVVADGERTVLLPPLTAGEGRRYSMRVTAPVIDGTLTLQVALVQEMVRWFDDPPHELPTCRIEIH
ncbi:MAG TPA: glycosyltransferase [Thermoanaerobaculia bacterium]|nr:glycosyltransferase [Thermoanaerobaculia bacterium]